MVILCVHGKVWLFRAVETETFGDSVRRTWKGLVIPCGGDKYLG